MSDEKPLSLRLSEGRAFFEKLASRFASMAGEAEQLERAASVCDEQRVFDLRTQVVVAEADRDEWRVRAQYLEEAIDGMRLGIVTPQEVIERARTAGRVAEA